MCCLCCAVLFGNCSLAVNKGPGAVDDDNVVLLEPLTFHLCVFSAMYLHFCQAKCEIGILQTGLKTMPRIDRSNVVTPAVFNGMCCFVLCCVVTFGNWSFAIHNRPNVVDDMSALLLGQLEFQLTILICWFQLFF